MLWKTQKSRLYDNHGDRDDHDDHDEQIELLQGALPHIALGGVCDALEGLLRILRMAGYALLLLIVSTGIMLWV